MVDVLADEIRRFVRAVGPEPDETLAEMDRFAEEHGFPHVGPEVGAFLRFVARMSDAERIFEFGSGYGYSAYWFADALPDDGSGEIVLTEVDEDELEQAREYMAAGGYDDLARYELGDAVETAKGYDGPFDVVLIDIQKHQYEDAFEAIRSKIPVGGVIVADNAISASVIEFENLLDMVEAAQAGDDAARRVIEAESNEHTRGIADYLDRVTADSAFETVVIPLGEGIAVSYRVE
ncbi:putative methyltransferase [Natrialba magadii ATCC 43099]|uniref:Methyltransferase n=1 Tax=Natrialba magadii (strain ATCC 43099 / DSM 3394 / CCM 3739 / CIP 104546 / IAM 13178 / JCM 8861 / NBRC 102185 / NCIMB 2190 / MS3) TaxID=547559 RepID=D3SR97_NATMM|nr:O-methyltransferase [Natrialba magadii]ADD06653.1 putative methyltransferase [Natrialba magadii ATCC 43099]ELY31886.1 O-methyltransferase family protein [Natrialba magadii ATCC 43099]